MAKNRSVTFGRITIDPERMRTVLTEQRTRLGLSQRELAKKAGVSPTTVFNLENGAYTVQLDLFCAVLGALGLLPDHVLQIDRQVAEVTLSAVEAEAAAIAQLDDVGEALVRLGKLIQVLKSET